jgi:hypothetical protein
MKKLLFIIIITLICILITLLFYPVGNNILNNYNMVFRPWVNTLMIILFGLFLMTILILFIIILIKLLKKPIKSNNLKILKKVSCVIGIILCILMLWIPFYIMLIGGAFSFREEHTVLRDDIKMLAIVDSFLQVSVYYYPYKNFMVMGNALMIYEDYGNGGYDPLDGEHSNKPEETTYYYER